MNKRYYFEIVLNGVGKTVEQARGDAIDGFILEPGELTVIEEVHLNEDYEEIDVCEKCVKRMLNGTFTTCIH